GLRALAHERTVVRRGFRRDRIHWRCGLERECPDAREVDVAPVIVAVLRPGGCGYQRGKGHGPADEYPRDRSHERPPPLSDTSESARPLPVECLGTHGAPRRRRAVLTKCGESPGPPRADIS